MLAIFVTLFKNLKSSNINYCVYKGLSHLKEDLDGLRGDIDMLVGSDSLYQFQQVLVTSGFMLIAPTKCDQLLYIGRDDESARFVLIDVVTELSCMFHKIVFSWEKVKLTTVLCDQIEIPVIALEDYIPLMLLLYLTASAFKQKGFEEINALIKKTNLKLLHTSYYGKQLLTVLPDQNLYECRNLSGWHKFWLNSHTEIKKKSKVWVIVQYYIKNHLPRIFFYKPSYILNRLFGGPIYKIAKGKSVAIVAVDGAGKSSIIKEIVHDPYYKITGVKKIYFGANASSNPFLLKAIDFFSSYRYLNFIKYFLQLVLKIQRQLRVFKLVYFRCTGNLVICDRYYYDDELSRLLLKLEAKKVGFKFALSNTLKQLISPRMFVRPDITIYLDVSPEVAYSRKQDFDFETMKLVNFQYREMMQNKPKVIMVDANRKFSAVCRDVFQIIKRNV